MKNHPCGFSGGGGLMGATAHANVCASCDPKEASMKFKVEIEMGNDAMQTKRDVRRALLALADRVLEADLTMLRNAEGRIRDENGNAVGEWGFYPRATRERKGKV